MGECHDLLGLQYKRTDHKRDLLLVTVNMTAKSNLHSDAADPIVTNTIELVAWFFDYSVPGLTE